MLALAAALREPVPSLAPVQASHWWAWSGGFFGAIYIAISILLLRRHGTAAFVALLVAGQMFASLAFDHYGLLAVTPPPTDITRIIGAILLVVGVVMIR